MVVLNLAFIRRFASKNLCHQHCHPLTGPTTVTLNGKFFFASDACTTQIVSQNIHPSRKTSMQANAIAMRQRSLITNQPNYHGLSDQRDLGYASHTNYTFNFK